MCHKFSLRTAPACVQMVCRVCKQFRVRYAMQHGVDEDLAILHTQELV